MSKELEALEGLENYINNIIFAKDLINQKQQLLTNINIIKQVLIKAQENEKVLSIIKEIITKTEDRLQDILRCKDYEEYKGLWYWEKELTEEEFKLLKEVLCNDNI